MKKFRQRILEIREGFLDARTDKMYPTFVLMNGFMIANATSIVIFVAMVFMVFKWYYTACIVSFLGIVVYVFFLTNEKAFDMVMPFSARLTLRLFGRYGRVVTKADWVKIKETCPDIYREMWKKSAIGHCYHYSLFIALFLEDAQLMYCSFTKKDGEKVAHSVIVKNNCVYCTNARHHFDLDEYKELYKVNVYKMFSEREYRSPEFIDSIREDFIKWCAENNVCCPTD